MKFITARRLALLEITRHGLAHISTHRTRWGARRALARHARQHRHMLDTRHPDCTHYTIAAK